MPILVPGSFWAFVAIFTIIIAAALVTAGNFVLAAALVAVFGIGAIYSRRGS